MDIMEMMEIHFVHLEMDKVMVQLLQQVIK